MALAWGDTAPFWWPGSVAMVLTALLVLGAVPGASPGAGSDGPSWWRAGRPSVRADLLRHADLRILFRNSTGLHLRVTAFYSSILVAGGGGRLYDAWHRLADGGLLLR